MDASDRRRRAARVGDLGRAANARRAMDFRPARRRQPLRTEPTARGFNCHFQASSLPASNDGSSATTDPVRRVNDPPRPPPEDDRESAELTPEVVSIPPARRDGLWTIETGGAKSIGAKSLDARPRSRGGWTILLHQEEEVSFCHQARHATQTKGCCRPGAPAVDEGVLGRWRDRLSHFNANEGQHRSWRTRTS